MKMKKLNLTKQEKKVNTKIAILQYLKMQKGVTLIALVITIIVLLILAGITLNLALDDNGIIRKALGITKDYKESEKNELVNLNKFKDNVYGILNGSSSNFVDYNDYIGAYVTGYTPDTKTCVIQSTTSGIDSKNSIKGETINTTTVAENGDQTFKTENLQWRIWDYDGETIRLISDIPTTATLNLKNAAGYNNGVYAINEICRQCYGQYSEKGEMKTGISVSNLKRSDIQKVITYDYTKYSHNNGSSTDENGNGKYKYGSTTTYSSKNLITYPIMWEKDNKWAYENRGGVITNENEKEGLIWELENDYTNETGTKSGSTSTQFKESSWTHFYDPKVVDKSDWINPKYYDLLLGSTDNHFNNHYWLSSRSVMLLWDDAAYFSICSIAAINTSFFIGCNWTYRSTR